MSLIQELIQKQVASSAKKGAFTISAVSKDQQFFKIINNADSSSFDIKVATLASKVKSGDYILHEDDSYDMKVAPVRTKIEY